ncbi:hypothetical protein Q1695_001178 [Nippostrongylus brasiliensis]|nr:hypothetical protein Q1695_001178 [Nippostrongylus brasiliensis]
MTYFKLFTCRYHSHPSGYGLCGLDLERPQLCRFSSSTSCHSACSAPVTQMHPGSEVAMRGLQSFLLSNKEAILSLLHIMESQESDRSARSGTSSFAERSTVNSSGSQSSSRSYSTENSKSKDTKSSASSTSSRENLFSRVEERRVRVYSRSNSANRSRSRSPSRSPPPRRRDTTPKRRREYSRSRSPPRREPYYRTRYRDGREDARPCRCIGIFGMNVETSERDLENIFQEFGEIDYIKIVRDHVTGRSRGFGFVYYLRTRDAAAAKAELKDARIDGMRVRVDFSVTNCSPGYRGSVGRPRRLSESSRYT